MNIRWIHLDETTSTNRFLHDYHDDADDDMVVVTADYQTAGRGQGTHSWESERGMNLIFSVLIHPKGVGVAEQFILAEVGALTLKSVLDLYTDGITLKWPNDVYWHDRKISGTLIETAVSAQGLKRCIYGVGMNVNQRVFRSDAPNPVSLFQITGHETDREELLRDIIDRLADNLQRLYDGERDTIRQAYHAALYRRDGLYPYADRHDSFMARIDHVSDDGHLILIDDRGAQRAYAFGEVSFSLNFEH